MKKGVQAGIFLGLGTNMGDRLQNLALANQFLEENVGTIIQSSSIYLTEAWGLKDQPAFYNQVIQIDSRLVPMEILERVLQIEKEMGRIRRQKWDRRIIDIDILFYGREIIQTPKLIVPHPFFQDRNFVMAPMAEIAPEFVHPNLKKSIAELLSSSNDPLECIPLDESRNNFT